MKMTDGQAAELLGQAAYYIGKAIVKLERVQYDSNIPIVRPEITKLSELCDSIGDLANKVMKEYKEKQKSA